MASTEGFQYGFIFKSLRTLCVLCVSAVNWAEQKNRGDAENAEVTQKRVVTLNQYFRSALIREIRG